VTTVLTGVVAIAAGDNHSLALKSDGTVVTWDGNGDVESTGPTGLNGVVAIAAGYSHSLALVAIQNQKPEIFASPQSQTTNAGANVTFTVAASGASPLKYQWRFNGNLIQAATNTSLSLTNVQFATAGGYSVVVTNSFGSVTSAVAQLTVYTNLVLTQTNRAPTTNEIGKPTIPTDPNYFKVFTNGNFQSGVALNPNKMTVVLTHGWKGSPSDWAQHMAQIIQQRIGSNTVNIVAWDWHVVASAQLDAAVQFTQGEGNQLSADLFTALGANYSQRIHFIGHSLGTLVNAAAANYLQAKGLQANGFSWTNMQMTLCDEAEIAWGTTSQDEELATLLALSENFSTPQTFWGNALPRKCAWADNYISACGLLHPEAANIILIYQYPESVPDVNLFYQELDLFHNYSHRFYEDTIEPGIYNTGGQTNANYAGFICSFEGGGFNGRPATNTYFYQDTVGLELHLVQTNLAFATNFLNARFSSFGTSLVVAHGVGWIFNGIGQAVGAVSGAIQSVGNNVGNMFVNLRTSLFGSGSSSSVTQSGSVRPLGGPVPNGGSANNTPAYAWIPLNVPSNAVSMSFDFMLQGNGNNDSFQAALNGVNILSLETSLIQTNVTLNSGLIGVSQYAGQQVELFLGIVGGTSTNAALTVSNFQFYVTLPPSLQIQLSGTNVVLTWPLSGAGYVLQSANKLAPPVSWTTVTNVPVIVNFQYTVTNQISSGSRFYRLAIITAPALQAQVLGNNFILSWPASASGYVLETTTNLTATNSWTAVANMPALLNQQSVVTNQISGAARFYRLKQQ